MTPAAFHRQTGPKKITEQFIRLATRLLLWGMLPLLIGLCIDIYLIARIIGGSLLASLLAVVVGGIFIALWFILPRMNNKQGTSAQ
jgi:sorbitol-specific phosphotransferase system component IIC